MLPAASLCGRGWVAATVDGEATVETAEETEEAEEAGGSLFAVCSIPAVVRSSGRPVAGLEKPHKENPAQ